MNIKKIVIAVVIVTIVAIAAIFAVKALTGDNDNSVTQSRDLKTEAIDKLNSLKESYDIEVNTYKKYKNSFRQDDKDKAASAKEKANSLAGEYNSYIEEKRQLFDGNKPNGLPGFLQLLK